MALTAKGEPGGLATLDDNGRVPGAQVAQAAAVADLVALTATAPAALTSAQLTGGESPTESEYNQLQADVAALRGVVAALVTDLDTARTKTNDLLAKLRTAGLLASS